MPAAVDPTIFASLRKYVRSPGRDAREDRVTEALAVALRAAPQAAASVVGTIFDGPVPSTTPSTATQRHIPGVGRVDLEIRFGPPGKPELLVWFENKVDALAYREQGVKYIDEMQRLSPKSWLFAWILRPNEAVAGGLPDDPRVQLGTWQDIATALQKWRRCVDQSSDHRGPWIVEQLLDHLEREEMLAFNQPFTGEDAETLRNIALAKQKLSELTSRAAEATWSRWGNPDPSQNQVDSHGDRVSFRYPCTPNGASSNWPASWFFEFVYDSQWPDQDGGPAVAAGLALRSADNEPIHTEQLANRLEGEGFEYSVTGRGHWVTLMRFKELEDLASVGSGISFSAQVESLSQWVVSSFQLLNTANSPYDPTNARTGDQPAA